MRWTERQRAMLREMGVQLWSRDVAPDDAAQAVAVAVAPPVDAAVAKAPTPLSSTVRTPPAWPDADWLVVGEPFDPADRQQELLLDNMLRAIGVSRTARTRTGRATFVALAEPASTGASPSGGRDRALIQAAIAAVAPRCAIAFGRAAAAAILDSDEPLGSLRGRRHERSGLAVVVTFSLAFLLRHPADKAKAWLDLCLAVGAFPAGADAGATAGR